MTDDPSHAKLAANRLGRTIALVSLTMVARAIAYTDVRCIDCGRWLMAIPGHIDVAVRSAKAGRTGRGRVIRCRNCGEVEVIEE